MMSSNENNIEFYKGQDTATAFFSQRKYVSKLEKLAEKHPDECNVIKNDDGSILAHFPVKWVKISPPKVVSEEQRQAASERFKKMHEENKLSK